MGPISRLPGDVLDWRALLLHENDSSRALVARQDRVGALREEQNKKRVQLGKHSSDWGRFPARAHYGITQQRLQVTRATVKHPLVKTVDHVLRADTLVRHKLRATAEQLRHLSRSPTLAATERKARGTATLLTNGKTLATSNENI